VKTSLPGADPIRRRYERHVFRQKCRSHRLGEELKHLHAMVYRFALALAAAALAAACVRDRAENGGGRQNWLRSIIATGKKNKWRPWMDRL